MENNQLPIANGEEPMRRVVVRDTDGRLRATAYLAPIALLLVGMVLTIPLLLIYAGSSITSGDTTAVAIPIFPALLMTIAMELIVVFWAAWYAGVLPRLRAILGLQNFNFKHLAVGLGVGAAFLMGLLAIEAGAKALGLEVADSDTAASFGALDGPLRYIVLFLFVSFLVPAIEEIFFRGYVFGFLLNGKKAVSKAFFSRPVFFAALFSAVVFGVLHFQGLSTPTDFMVLIWTTLFALASAWLYHRFQSLYPSIAAHSIYNFISALFIAFT